MPTPEPSAKRILIVDDDAEMRAGLRIMLEKQGYRVIEATNGVQAKELVYRHRPDLMILDMMMPRMGGYPVLEHFRGKADAPPIIMDHGQRGQPPQGLCRMAGRHRLPPQALRHGAPAGKCSESPRP